MFFEDLATLLSTFSDSPAILISFCNFFINFLFCFDRMRFSLLRCMTPRETRRVSTELAAHRGIESPSDLGA